MVRSLRKVAVEVIDNDRSYLKILSKYLKAELNGRNIGHFLRTKLPDQGRSVGENVEAILRREDADVYFIDYRLGKFDGLELARLINKERPKASIVMMSAYRDLKGCSFNGKGEYIVDAWDKNDLEELAEILDSHLWKPIKIGIEGFGNLGKSISEYCLDSESVREIHLDSQRVDVEEAYGLLEEERELSKIRTHGSLEDMLDEIDILLFTSSTMRGFEIASMAKSSDRREILVTELERYGKFFESVRRGNFDGPIVILANPVPYLMKYGRISGIAGEKLFTPMEPDSSRLYKALAAREQSAEEHKAEIYKRVLGVHGVPTMLMLPEWMESDDYEDFRAVKEDSERRAREAGDNAARAMGKLKLVSGRVAQSVMPFLEDFASFKNPRMNCHSYISYDFSGKRHSGFAAFPVKVNWKKEEISLNEEVIDEIGREEVYRASAPFLENQQRYIESIRDQIIRKEKSFLP